MADIPEHILRAQAERQAKIDAKNAEKNVDKKAARGLTEMSPAAAEAKRIEDERKERRAKAAEEKKLREEEKRLHGDDKNWKIRKVVDQAMSEHDSKPRVEGYNSSSIQDPILVCARSRPILPKEIAAKDFKILSFSGDRDMTLHDVKKNKDLSLRLDSYDYTFDFAFDECDSNEDVYQMTLMPMIDSIFSKNQKVSMFAYGQTGSGKTYTMMSIFKQAVSDMFNGMQSPELYESLGLELSISFYEVYQGKVIDLFNKRAVLDVLEDSEGNVNIRGLQELFVHTTEDVLHLLDLGSKARASRATEMNDTSSRSHAILKLVLRDSEQNIHGSLTLIDLAGSEKASDTPNSDKKMRNEASEINKSLLALKECIRSMNDSSTHIPFRGSKLTMILRESLIGENSRAIMVACLSPGYSRSEATLNTLRYADRLKTAGELDAETLEGKENSEELARIQKLNELRAVNTPPPESTPAPKAAAAPTAKTTPASATKAAAPKRTLPTAKPTASRPAPTPATTAAAAKTSPPSTTAAVKAVSTATDIQTWMVEIGIPERDAGEYARRLSAEGFDDVDSLVDVTEEELDQMFQIKLGHRRKIMRYRES